MSYVLNYVASPVRNYVSSLLVSALSKYIIGIEVNCPNVVSWFICSIGNSQPRAESTECGAKSNISGNRSRS